MQTHEATTLLPRHSLDAYVEIEGGSSPFRVKTSLIPSMKLLRHTLQRIGAAVLC